MFNRMKIPRSCPHCHSPVNMLPSSDGFDVLYEENRTSDGKNEPSPFGEKFCPHCSQTLFARCEDCKGKGYILKSRNELYCTNCGKLICPKGRVKFLCTSCSGKGGSWMPRIWHDCLKATY